MFWFEYQSHFGSTCTFILSAISDPGNIPIGKCCNLTPPQRHHQEEEGWAGGVCRPQWVEGKRWHSSTRDGPHRAEAGLGDNWQGCGASQDPVGGVDRPLGFFPELQGWRGKQRGTKGWQKTWEKQDSMRATCPWRLVAEAWSTCATLPISSTSATWWGSKGSRSSKGRWGELLWLDRTEYGWRGTARSGVLEN